MSSVFLDYSKYYDVLYKDKNYQGEVDFIVGLIKKHAPHAKTILNLGCGTGNHDFLLAAAGYQVTGVDLSEEMIAIARQKNTSNQCTFVLGDARSVKLDQKFDVVISLFHVLSYQNSNHDVDQFLSTMKSFMVSDGVAIFDYWYGPAVLSIKPEARSKVFESEDLKVERKARTDVDYVKNIATVNYDIQIHKKADAQTTRLTESHPMRFFFSPELELFFDRVGFSQVRHSEWMSDDQAPNENSWAAYSVVKNTSASK